MFLPLNRAKQLHQHSDHLSDDARWANAAPVTLREFPSPQRSRLLHSRRQGSSHLPVLILIIVLAMIATILCYRVFLSRVDVGLRAAVTKELQALFPAASVYVGRVTADGADKLIVSDVRMAIKGQLPKREVMSAERVVLQGDLDISHYLQQSIRVEQVDIFAMQIDAWPLGEEKWSIECLKPHPKPNTTPPTITFHNTLLHLHRDATEQAANLTIHDIHGRIEHRLRSSSAPQAPSPTGLPMISAKTFAMESTPPAASVVTYRGNRSLIHLTGRSSGLVRKLEVRGEYDPVEQSVKAMGSIDDFNFSPKLIEQLPQELARYLKQLSGLECRASSTFEIVAAPNQPASFRLQGNLVDGRLQDQRLPYPLEQLRSEFFCKNSLLQIRSMQARSGGTQLTLNTDIMGFGLDSPMVIHAQARDLDLDKRLYSSLPASWQQQWDRLELAGRFSGDIKLSFDGLKWSPSAVIECQDVSLKPWLFPFPISAIRGTVVYQNGSIRSERLEGLGGGQALHASLNLTRSDQLDQADEWYGALQCKSDGPIAINEDLISALTPIDKETTDAERFVRSLHPAGAIELVGARFERATPQDRTWQRTIDANIYNGRITYDGFKYPIWDIRGRLVGQNDEWQLDRFEGRNDSGRILCSGNWLNVKQGQIPFRLVFNAFDVPAQEELKNALPSDAQFIWDELQPSGTVDSVTATIERLTNESQVDVRVELLEDHTSNQVTGRSLSLMPKSFPYRLVDVGCNITYEPGFVSIVSASAVNGSSRLSLTGECRPNETGRWQGNVRWLPTTRVIVDSQLLAALPRSVRDSLLKLDFSGPVSIFGESQMLFANKQYPDLVTGWNCQLDIEDGRLADGKNIGALRGTVWIEGHSDGTHVNASGSLAMDALTVRDIPVTNLKGPFAILGSRLYFGSRVSDVLPRVGQPVADPITADALSGKLTLSGESRLEVGKFLIDAELRNAQLTTMLQDVGVDRASTEAMCNATLHFEGVPWNPQTHVGAGSIRLTDAKLYQLPFMMRILRGASINASDDSAFQTADINFQIDGDRIPLQIACDGDVLRLRGEGWTNLRRELNLELYSYVGRRVPISHVISPLLAESRYATLMKIDVQGTLDNPILKPSHFPQLEATLQQIFPEVAERRSIGDALPWRR